MDIALRSEHSELHRYMHTYNGTYIQQPVGTVCVQAPVDMRVAEYVQSALDSTELCFNPSAPRCLCEILNHGESRHEFNPRQEMQESAWLVR